MKTFYFLNQRGKSVEAALKYDARAVVVTKAGNHEYDRLERFPDFSRLEVPDPLDPLEVLHAMTASGARFADQDSVCIGLGDDSSQTASLINACLDWGGGRYASFRSLENMRDKYRLRSLTADAAPELTGKYMMAKNGQEVRDFLMRCPSGIILKPRDGAGSRGVQAILGPGDVDAVDGRTTYPVLLEERFTGPEFSVESITWKGEHQPLVVTQKRTGGLTGLVETGQRQPADILDGDRDALMAAARKILDIAGYEYGLSHIEFILQGKQPKLVEAHGRVGGDRISDMMEWSTGMNGFDRLIRAYLDDRVTPPMSTGMGARIEFPDLRGWTGSDEAWIHTMLGGRGVVEAVILRPRNERGEIRCSGDRHAHIVSTFELQESTNRQDR